MTRFSSLVAIAAVATVTSDALVPGADAARLALSQRRSLLQSGPGNNVNSFLDKISTVSAGVAIGIVGDAGVRANAQQPKLEGGEDLDFRSEIGRAEIALGGRSDLVRGNRDLQDLDFRSDNGFLFSAIPRSRDP